MGRIIYVYYVPMCFNITFINSNSVMGCSSILPETSSSNRRIIELNSDICRNASRLIAPKQFGEESPGNTEHRTS